MAFESWHETDLTIIPGQYRQGVPQAYFKAPFCEGGDHLRGMSCVKHGRGSKEPHDCMSGFTDAC